MARLELYDDDGKTIALDQLDTHARRSVLAACLEAEGMNVFVAGPHGRVVYLAIPGRADVPHGESLALVDDLDRVIETMRDTNARARAEVTAAIRAMTS